MDDNNVASKSDEGSFKFKLDDGSEILITDDNIPTAIKHELSLHIKILKFIEKYFILIGLAIVIPLAGLYPIGHNNGPLKPKITSSWIMVILLFFIIGLNTKIENLRKAIFYWQLNLFTQSIVFIAFPLFGFLIALLLKNINPRMEELLNGYVILCCLPATAVSAAVLAANANGNDIAAAVNCTLANLVGIIITPYLILFLLQDTGEIDELNLFVSLILRIIVPIIVAQIIRFIIGKRGNAFIVKQKRVLKKINEIVLLYMVFCALSESFYNGIDTNAVDVIIIIFVIIGTHLFFNAFTWYLSGFLRCLVDPNKSVFLAFSVYDRIGILFTATSKTIAFGIPLIETMYADNDNVGLYMIGILLYKPTQLIVGSLLVEPLSKLAHKEMEFLSNYTKSTKSTLKTLYSQNYAALSPYSMNKSKVKLSVDFID
mmetsp:Transcript_108751/g.132723  ORF Transcript_108751/g.132723 Transcript_108751/m.132723 type:complete len:430 (+) Transcript_108751:343-1632(+)